MLPLLCLHKQHSPVCTEERHLLLIRNNYFFKETTSPMSDCAGDRTAGGVTCSFQLPCPGSGEASSSWVLAAVASPHTRLRCKCSLTLSLSLSLSGSHPCHTLVLSPGMFLNHLIPVFDPPVNTQGPDPLCLSWECSEASLHAGRRDCEVPDPRTPLGTTLLTP